MSLDLDRSGADGVPPLEAAAFVATPQWVDEVWVGGERLVEGGRHSRATAENACLHRIFDTHPVLIGYVSEGPIGLLQQIPTRQK